MSEELRAAVEGARRHDADKSRWCDKPLDERRRINEDWSRHAAVIVAAYLAANPADDAEPVTEEWLRSVGFAAGKFPTDLVRGPVVRGVITNPLSRDNGRNYWVVRTYPIPDEAAPRTRGDLRRLLLALGVG